MAYGSVTLNNVRLTKINHAVHKATIVCDEFPQGVQVPTIQMAPADWDRLRDSKKASTVDVLRQWFELVVGQGPRVLDANGVEHLPYMGPKTTALKPTPTVKSTRKISLQGLYVQG